MQLRSIATDMVREDNWMFKEQVTEVYTFSANAKGQWHNDHGQIQCDKLPSIWVQTTAQDLWELSIWNIEIHLSDVFPSSGALDNLFSAMQWSPSIK